MNHAASRLPSGKKWKLVWNDEFDGPELDKSKWDFRRYLLQTEHKTLIGEEGLEFRGDSCVRLKRVKKGNDFYSCQLQTGYNFLDVPGKIFYENSGHDDAPQFRWPVDKLQKHKFTHKFGYYELRCKLQTQPDWWSAFWLQSPVIGSSLDPRTAGVEVDIMEAFHPDGSFDCNNHWGGYGPDHESKGTGPNGRFKLEKTPDDFHLFGLEWTPDCYIYYADGKEVWRCDGPVSRIEEFILISTECQGYRKKFAPSPALAASTHPDDEFVVDFVRVYDEVPD